jgi:hypothetical protein
VSDKAGDPFFRKTMTSFSILHFCFAQKAALELTARVVHFLISFFMEAVVSPDPGGTSWVKCKPDT